MGLVYDDDEGSTLKMRAAFMRAPRKYEDLPATRIWCKHYENYLYLDFISKNPRATFHERQQANRELVIAQRKMTYWERHPNFNAKAAQDKAAELKRAWEQKRGQS